MASRRAGSFPLRTVTVDAPSSVDNNNPILPSWSKAIDLFNSKLTKDEAKKIDLKSCQRASFPDLLSAATTARDKAEQGRYPWTVNLQRIFSQINRFAPAGDVIAQHHPEYTSLAWGAFRFLLLVAAEEGTTSAQLSGALESVSQIIFRAEEYENLFSAHSGSSTGKVFQSLQENTTHLYAEVLNFLIRATAFFEKPTWRRYLSAGFSPFEAKFRKILDGVDRLERNIEKDIAVLRSEEVEIRQQEYENGVWLQHADFAVDLQNLLELHVTGTCEWFLQSDRYIEWLQPFMSTKSNLLWVQGKPGSGKSTLAAQIVQDIQSRPGSIALFVLCKDSEENKNDLGSILRNLVFQLLESSPQRKSFHQIMQTARLNAKTPRVQSIAILWTLLERMLGGNGQLYCILDGLDECCDPVKERIPFLRQLTEIFTIQSDITRLMIISRLEPSELGEDLSRWERIQIRSSDVRNDIRKFATTEIEKNLVMKTHPDKEHILRVLIDSSDGMILWTVLMIKELERRRWDIQRVLERPPRGLSSIYTSILKRIVSTAESVEKVQHALQLILAAARPLRLEELSLGLAIMEGLHSHDDYDLVGDPTAEGRAIVLSSQPLLTVMPDETVEVAHSSLRDHFFDTSTQSDTLAFRFQDNDVQYTMAKVVLSYLSLECFSSELSDEGQHKYHFLEYASCWLLYHSSKSGNSKEIAEGLVTFFNTRQGWRWLQRLSDEYVPSFGHLQLMQSQLNIWGRNLDLSRQSQDILSNFLSYLAQRRYEETKLLSVDQQSVLRAMANLASTYWNQGRWNEAEELEAQVMKTTERVLGAEHPDTLTSIANLASTYRNQGRWNEAEELGAQVMKMTERVLGAEHPDTLTSVANLASTYWNQGRWNEAEELEAQVMKTTERVLGAQHPDTLTSIANLASTYRDQGRWNEAEELEVQVIETRKRVLGAEHPSTLTSMANLASTYRNQGRWNEAEELGAQVMKMTERVLGAEHPDTLTSMINLASTYRNQGRWNEAEELGAQVMKMTERVLGAEHPDTLTSVANLASTYWNQGRWNEAEELEAQVMKTTERVLGAEHPSTLTSIANLASTYWNQGRWNEAEELEAQVMKTTERVLGAEHPSTLTSIANLASTYRNQGRWNEAEELGVQVIETRKRVLGAEHPSTLTSIINLTSTYRNQGRWNEAEELGAQVMKTTERVLGAEHPDTLTSIANLASTYRDQGRWNEAEELEVQVMETRKRVLGAEHPSTLTSMANLASTYRNQGRWNEAEELGAQVMKMTERVLGAEHPDTLTSIANLASTYRNQGRWNEAEELEVQVIETRKRVLGAEHPSTLTSIANLASTYWNQGRWNEAEELEVQAMETRKRVLGAEHPDTLASMHDLAYIWRSQERAEEATGLMKQAERLRREKLGPNHPHTKLSTQALCEWEREQETARDVTTDSAPNTNNPDEETTTSRSDPAAQVEPPNKPNHPTPASETGT